MHSRCTPTRIDKAADGTYTVHFKDGMGADQSLSGVGLVMMATGRAPRVAGIGLEAAGVEMDSHSAIKVGAVVDGCSGWVDVVVGWPGVCHLPQGSTEAVANFALMLHPECHVLVQA